MSEWDYLAERFNTKKTILNIHHDAAVNIFVGWPIFLQNIKIQKEYLGTETLDILDFGCGSGRLCQELFEQRNKVVGIDASKKMLELAKNNIDEKINVINAKDFFEDSKFTSTFDVITSMHVLDWIENVEDTLDNLSRTLKVGGIILFAVFPKEHIIDSIRINDLFENFDSNTNPKIGYANFEGIKVKVYVRNAEFYDKYFQKRGYSKLLEMYPPYPKFFLDNYKWTGSLKPEMLILGYRKTQ